PGCRDAQGATRLSTQADTTARLHACCRVRPRALRGRRRGWGAAEAEAEAVAVVGDGGQDGGAGEDGGQVEPAVAPGGARGRVADRDQPGGVVGRPGPGAPPGAEQLE